MKNNDVDLASKTVRHKHHNDILLFSIPIYLFKDLLKNFITSWPK